jgi:hypothetical protein
MEHCGDAKFYWSHFNHILSIKFACHIINSQTPLCNMMGNVTPPSDKGLPLLEKKLCFQAVYMYAYALCQYTSSLYANRSYYHGHIYT